MQRKLPESILNFALDIKWRDRNPIYTYRDESGLHTVNQGTGFESASCHLQIDIPLSIISSPNRERELIKYIRNLLDEWERNIENPDINGREPQLGGKK